jgi:hypothetical protein
MPKPSDVALGDWFAAMATFIRYMITVVAFVLALVFLGWVVAIGLVAAGYPEIREVEPAIHFVSRFAAADWLRLVAALTIGTAGGMWLQWAFTPRPPRKRTSPKEMKHALSLLSKSLDDLYAEGVLVRNALKARGENLLDYEEYFNDRAAQLVWVRKVEDLLDNDMIPASELAFFRHGSKRTMAFDADLDEQQSFTAMVWEERLKRLRGIINRIENDDLDPKAKSRAG